MFQQASLVDLPAFCCGHAQDLEAGTGCTVVIAPDGAVCGVDVRGGGPATRETDLLKPENMIQAVHAVVLSGGSAFGLEASSGVMECLAERGIGFKLGEACVPIVVGACLFDLLLGENKHPDKNMGYRAALAALEDTADRAALEGGACGGGFDVIAEGNVGAGTGATVGKLLDPSRAMKSGLGVYGVRVGDVVVVTLVAVNALGHVCDRDGNWIAGCLSSDGGKVLDPLQALAEMMQQANAAASTPSDSGQSGLCENTTIGVVLTNAKLTKAQATKCSSVVHDAYARSIKPVHTSNDGDAIFTFASGEVECLPDFVGILATEAMQGAIVRAVTQSEGAYGLRAACDIQ